MPAPRHTLPLALALSLGACAQNATSKTTKATTSPTVTKQPRTTAAKTASMPIKEMLKRERAVMSKRALVDPQGSFAAQVEAIGPPTIKRTESYHYVTIPIGAEVPVECFIYSSVLDTATSLRNVLQTISKNATQRDPVSVSADVVAGLPYLRLTAPYLVQKKGKPLLMTLKMMGVPYPNAGLICLQNEVGYEATFTRVVEGLASSLRFKSSPPIRSFNYADVGMIYLGGKPIGFIREFERVNDKGLMAFEFTSMLVPLRDGKLFCADYAASSELAGGQVVAMKKAASVNGAMKHVLSLQRVSKQRYAISGEREGQPIDVKVSARQPLYSSHEEAKRVRRHFIEKGAKDPLMLLSYLPGRDPTKLTEVRFHKIRALPKGGDLTVKTEAGGRVIARMTFDVQARARRLHTRMGSLDLRIERRFSTADK